MATTKLLFASTDSIGTSFETSPARRGKNCRAASTSRALRCVERKGKERNMDLAINNPVWDLYDAPWKKTTVPAERLAAE